VPVRAIARPSSITRIRAIVILRIPQDRTDIEDARHRSA
jgi:hypothetical protein